MVCRRGLVFVFLDLQNLFAACFCGKKQQQKSKVPKNALILDLLQHANIPSASSAVGQPRNQPREHAIKEMLCCWQTSKVRCQELLLDTADSETFSPTFVDFFFLLGDARNIDRSKGDEFPKFLPVFFFWGGMGYDLFSLYIVPFSFLSLNLAEV